MPRRLPAAAKLLARTTSTNRKTWFRSSAGLLLFLDFIHPIMPYSRVMAAPTQRLNGIALASAGAIAFSGKAIIVKLAYRYGVDAVTLIMYRMLFALPMFVLLSWWAGRGKPALEKRDVITIVGLGFSGYYLASFLDFAGLQYITA